MNGFEELFSEPDGPAEGWTPAEDRLPSLTELRWRPSYEREEIERFRQATERERQELEAAIADARARAADAAAAPFPASDGDLVALVLAAQEELAALEDDHRRVLADIHAAAEAEAARILDAARHEVAEVRRRAATVADVPGPDDVGTRWEDGHAG